MQYFWNVPTQICRTFTGFLYTVINYLVCNGIINHTKIPNMLQHSNCFVIIYSMPLCHPLAIWHARSYRQANKCNMLFVMRLTSNLILPNDYNLTDAFSCYMINVVQFGTKAETNESHDCTVTKRSFCTCWSYFCL